VRRSNTYARRASSREPYDYVLIVCEGGKTEPNYFHGLKRAYRLSNANIEIAYAGATDPLSIVNYANSRLTEEGFDRAYCVFDRDRHSNYQQALNFVQTRDNGRARRLFAVPSVPCFEVWILLHFGYSTAPYNASGSNSACDNVLRALKEHFPDYAKGFREVYGRVAPKTAQAITHARRLDGHNSQTNSSNPYTRVHDLVEYLCNLKKP